ncbi:hypothetical protein L6164_002441 [Bauhinia variegata]|uniref:Uncharacterized protein n=2 Tax=Bauhinia variegata TaxID=167791 RepID=A0ACB9Q3N6_BAUVA|nr:hypothetical protein L6164_002441 [Bauhinia variegata]
MEVDHLSGLGISMEESSASFSVPQSKPEGKTCYVIPLNYAAKSTSALAYTKTNPKPGPCASNTPMIPDYCTLAGIPYDNTLHKYVPRDEKDELLLKLVPRVKELQDELQSWTDWANQKVMQVTQRLMKYQSELKTLRKEKQEAELWEKEILKMENVVANHSIQIERHSSVTPILESENAKLKKELSAAKALAVKEAAKLEQALEREKMALKEAQLWKSENENGLLLDELRKEKRTLSNLQQEVEKKEMLEAKVEARMERERAAKEKLLTQAALIRKEREQIEACSKSQENMIRKKAVADMEDYVEKIVKLEKELVELKSKHESGKIAALRENIDENKSSQKAKGNKKSNASQITATSEASGTLKRERECVMCLSEETSLVFLPCAHQVVCVECNDLHEKQGLKECPTCRTPIQRRIHSRFSEM